VLGARAIDRLDQFRTRDLLAVAGGNSIIGSVYSLDCRLHWPARPRLCAQACLASLRLSPRLTSGSAIEAKLERPPNENGGRPPLDLRGMLREFVDEFRQVRGEVEAEGRASRAPAAARLAPEH
jgi:hypothetical protein